MPNTLTATERPLPTLVPSGAEESARTFRGLLIALAITAPPWLVILYLVLRG